jgi:hypothetical protein
MEFVKEGALEQILFLLILRVFLYEWTFNQCPMLWYPCDPEVCDRPHQPARHHSLVPYMGFQT